ncbi:hypothetical protein DNTS_033540 [Danionella cerebrum]|uniref:Ig-like domain-containing protein n=1 Tax=Danionella cerebrum TaxID=2873325 RepID=A0A553N1J0_9TELE|nr:hypothetical protein DNTS_033540 [Danionella translucida]
MATWKLVVCSLSLLTVIPTSFGLEVTMSQASVEAARGDDVTLTCNFKPKYAVNELIVVTWIGDADETSGEKVLFGNYYSNNQRVDIDPQYISRASIVTDLNAKSSQLTLRQLTLKESRRIRCYVQIPGDIEGKSADTTLLLVQIAPSQPVCKVIGKAEYGHNISLTCESEEASPTPTYKWERYDVKNLPKQFPIKTTEKDGVLSLVNVSIETSGYYICLSSNKVGSAKCNMTLSVMPPSMNLATIGIVAGCVAGGIVLIIVIVCCCRRRKRNKKSKQYPVEIPAVEYHDKTAEGNLEEGKINMAITEEKTKNQSGRNDFRNDDNKSGQDDFKGHNDDHRSSRDGLRDDYDDRSDRFDEKRDRYDDRRGSRDNLNDRYSDRRDRYDYRGSRDDVTNRYDDRRGSRDDLADTYDDRRDRYDRRGSRDDLTDRYEDRRGSRDELRDRYDDRRGSRDELRDRGSRDELRDRYDDRKGSRDDLRDRYDDRRDRYDDRKS